jgi:hypothetical protein
MTLLLHAFLMIILVRLLIDHDRPWVFAAVYAFAWLALLVLYASGSTAIAVVAVTAFIAAGVFFTLLSRLDNALLWWGVALAGNVVVLLLTELALGAAAG